jgi:WD40 repeat protein
MIIGLEIGMLVAGLYALIRGRLPVTRDRVLHGAAARVTGVVLLLPIPLAFLVGLVYGLLFGLGAPPADLQKLQTTGHLIEAGVALACLAGSMVLAWSLSPGPKEKAKRPRARDRAESIEEDLSVEDIPEAEPVEDAEPALGFQADRPPARRARPPAEERESPRRARPPRRLRAAAPSSPIWPWLLLAGLPVGAGLLVLAGAAGYWLANPGLGGSSTTAPNPAPVAPPPKGVPDERDRLLAQARDEAFRAQRAALAAQEEALRLKQEDAALRRAKDQGTEQAWRQANELRDQAAAARRQADADRAQMLAEKRKADEAKKQADLSHQAEEAAKRHETQAHYQALIACAEREVRQGRPGRADDLLNACRPEGRGWEWYLLKRWTSPPMKTFSTPQVAENVRFSSDGKRLAVATLFQNGVRFLDAEGGKEVFTLPHGRPVFDFAFGPGGKFVVTSDGTLHVWDAGGKPQPALPGAAGTGAVALSPDGKWLAVATIEGDGRSIALWDLEARKAVHTWPVAFTSQPGLAFSPDGKQLACAAWVRKAKGQGGQLTVYAVTERKEAYAVPHVAGPVAFSPDGRRLAVLGGNRVVKLLDATGGRELATLVPGGEEIYGLAFHPAGRLLATAGSDGAVRLWDTQIAAPVRVLHHGRPAGSVAFSPDGVILAVTDKFVGGSRPGGLVRVWQLRDPDLLTIRVPGKAVRSLDFTRDGQRLVTAQDDGAVVVWDAVTGRSLRTLEGHRGSARAVAYRPNGKQIASAAVAVEGGAGELILWDAETGKPAFRSVLPVADNLCLAYSRDGQTLACAARRSVGGLEEGALGLWSADTGARLQQVQEKGHGFNGVVFSRDSTQVFVACRDNDYNGQVRLWDFPNNWQGLGVASCRSGYAAVAILAGPDRLVAVSYAGRVTVQELPTRQKLVTPDLVAFSAAGVRCLAPSADGSRLATAGAEDVVRLWDLAGGRELLALHAPGVVHVAAFSPDGKRLAAGGDRTDGGGFLRIWVAAE